MQFGNAAAGRGLFAKRWGPHWMHGDAVAFMARSKSPVAAGSTVEEVSGGADQLRKEGRETVQEQNDRGVFIADGTFRAIVSKCFGDPDSVRNGGDRGRTRGAAEAYDVMRRPDRKWRAGGSFLPEFVGAEISAARSHRPTLTEETT